MQEAATSSGDAPRRAARLEEFRFIFVVTYARSGSTLMQSLLNSVPGVQIRGENDNLLYHLFRVFQATEAIRRSADAFVTHESDRPWYGAREARTRIFEGNLLNNFLRNILVPSAGVRVVGFKEIRSNRKYIPDDLFAPYRDFLLSQFPGARIVFNSRRADDVAVSAWLAKKDREQTVALVRSADARFASYAARRPDRAIHMQYEDYTADHTRIHRMMRFLELEFAPEAIEAVFAKPLEHGQKRATARRRIATPRKPA